MVEAKERPILFSAPMVRALLAGTKTQTRRIAKPVKHPDLGNIYDAGALVLEHEPQHVIDRACPYGQPGDRLWVRETWQHANHPFGPYQDHTPVFYRADYLDDPHGPDGELSPEGRYREWRPSIHMPRPACRLVLEVAAVRLERLHGISQADAMAEGVWTARVARESGILDRSPGGGVLNHVGAFRDLWQEINGAGAWDANPWVWVVEFCVLIGREAEDQ